MTKKDIRIMFGLGIAVFIFYALFSNLFTVTNPVEVNYALSAKEMLLNNSFISPIIFGNYWYDKPPLTYWGLMASYKIFGFTNFAARVPGITLSSLSTMAMFASTKVLTKSLRTAVFAAVLLATSLEFWYLGHAVVTDGYLFLSSIGIFTFSFLALSNQSKKHMIYAYIAAGFAVLAKGPVGLVLPGAVLIAFMIVRRNKKDLAIVFNPIGILIFLAIALPWNFAMYQIHGEDFILGFLGLHNYVRATVSEHPEVNYWFYYLALTPIYLLPWTSFTVYEWVQDYKTKYFKTNALRQFQWLWFIIVILFYSIVATKYITYTFISMIPAIMMTAQGVNRIYEAPLSKTKQLMLSFSSLFFLCTLLVIATKIEKHSNPSLMILILIFAILSAIFAHRKVNVKSYPIVAAFSALMFFLALAPSIIPILEIRSAEVYSKQIEAMNPNQVYFYYDYDTSYTYYTGRIPLRVIDNINLPFNVWDEGKNVMPHKYIKDMSEAKDFAPRSIIIVKDRYVKYFETFPFSKDFHQVGSYDRFVFFGNYKPSKTVLTTKQ